MSHSHEWKAVSLYSKLESGPPWALSPDETEETLRVQVDYLCDECGATRVRQHEGLPLGTDLAKLALDDQPRE